MRSKLASSIAILLNYGAKWRALYYIFYVMCVNIELSIVVNGRQLFSPAQGSREDQTAQHKKDLTTITKSLLGVILNALDLGQMELSTVAIFITMVILIVIIPFTLLAMCLGWGKIVRSCGRFILIVLSLNDFFLLLLFTLLQRTLTCRDYKIIYVTETKVDSAEALFVPAYWVENSNGIKEVIDSRPDLSMDITCYQSKHIILLGMLFISLIGSLGLKLVQSRFFQHQLDFNYSMKKSNLDYLHFGSLTGLVCFRLFYFLGTKQDMEPSLYLYVALIIMGLSYLMHLYRDTFIKPSENVVRSTEIGFLLFAVIVVLVERAFLDQVLHLGKTTFFIAEILIVVMVFRLTAIARKTGVSLKSYNENNEKLKSDFEDLVIACFHYLQRILDSKQPEQLKSELADSIFTVFANSKRQLGSKHPVIQCIGWMLAHFKRSGSFRGSADYGLSELEETILDQKQNISNEATQAYPQYARVIDTVDESTQREIKEVVKLLGLLLAEYFKLKSNLMLTAPQYMLSSLVYYHLIYAVKPAIAVNLIKQAAKSGRPEDLHTKIMEQTVHLLLERAWTTGNLFMPEQRSRLRFKCDQENKVNFRQTTKYLAALDSLKSGISDLIDLKYRLLVDVDGSEFDVAKLYDSAQKFTQIKRGCDGLLKAYNTTPFKLLEGFYYYNIEYNFRRSFRVLKPMRHLPFKFFGSSDQLEAQKDSMVLSVCLELRILTATSNCRDHVGYTSLDLIDSNLDLLLPLPIKLNHHRLIQSGSGVLLEWKQTQQLFVTTNLHVIKSMNLGLRAALDLEKGFSVIGRLDFSEDREESACTIIIDRKLAILEVSANAKQLVQKGTSIKQYSKKWAEMLSSYITVVDFKMKHENTNKGSEGKEKDYSNTVSLSNGETLSTKLLQQFKEAQDIAQVSIMNKDRESVTLLFRSSVLRIRMVEDCYYTVTFSVHGDADSHSLLVESDFSKSMSNNQLVTMGSDSNAMSLTMEHQARKGKGRGKAEYRPIKESRQFLHSIDKIFKIRLKVYFDTIMQRYDYPEGSVVTQRKVVHYGGIKNNITTVSVFCLYTLVLVGMFAEVIFTNLRYFDRSKNFSILVDQSKYMDTASWSVWSTLCLQSISDVSRMVYENAVPNDYFDKYGVPDILAMSNEQKASHSMGLFLNSRFTDLYISRLEKTRFIPAALLERRELQLEVFDVAKYAETGEVEFELKLTPPMEAFTIMQPYIEQFIARDDTLPESADPLDPIEEMLRYNLMNPLHEYSITTSQDVNAYLTNMSADLVLFMRSSLSYSAIFAFSLFVFLGATTYWISRKARNFILKVLNFRRIDVKNSAKGLLALKLYFKMMAMDERDYFAKLDGHIVSQLAPRDLSRINMDTAGNLSTRSTQKLNMSSIKKRRIVRIESERVRVRNKTYFFGLWTYLLSALVILGIWMAIRYLAALADFKEVKLLDNLIRLYSITVDMWNSNISIQLTLRSMALWGSKATSMNLPAQRALQKMVYRLSNIIIPAMEKMRGADLREFTDGYRNLTTNFNICEELKAKSEYYSHCGEGVTSYLDGNILSVLTNTVSLVDSVSQQIIKAGDDLTLARKVFENPIFNAYLFYAGMLEATTIDGHISEIYYAIIPFVAVEITNLVELRVTSHKDSTLLLIHVLLSTIAIVLLWLLVCKPLQGIKRNLANLLLLIDYSLLRTNSFITKLLKL